MHFVFLVKAFSLRNIVCPRVDTSEDASRLHEAACCKHQGAASFGRLDHKHGRVKAAALAAGTHFHWIFISFIMISGLCFHTVLSLVYDCYDMGNCTSYYSTLQQLQGGSEAPGDLLFFTRFPTHQPSLSTCARVATIESELLCDHAVRKLS